MLPSDILGYTYLKKEKFEVNKGPIFTNIVLADELNRASPKTERFSRYGRRNVTIDKKTFELKNLFLLSQHKIHLIYRNIFITRPQLDRFAISFSLDELDQSQRLKNFIKSKNHLQISRVKILILIKLNQYQQFILMRMFYIPR